MHPACVLLRPPPPPPPPTHPPPPPPTHPPTTPTTHTTHTTHTSPPVRVPPRPFTRMCTMCCTSPWPAVTHPNTHQSPPNYSLMSTRPSLLLAQAASAPPLALPSSDPPPFFPVVTPHPPTHPRHPTYTHPFIPFPHFSSLPITCPIAPSDNARVNSCAPHDPPPPLFIRMDGGSAVLHGAPALSLRAACLHAPTCAACLPARLSARLSPCDESIMRQGDQVQASDNTQDLGGEAPCRGGVVTSASLTSGRSEDRPQQRSSSRVQGSAMVWRGLHPAARKLAATE